MGTIFPSHPKSLSPSLSGGSGGSRQCVPLSKEKGAREEKIMHINNATFEIC